MRQKHYLEAVAWKLRDSCLGWPTVSSGPTVCYMMLKALLKKHVLSVFSYWFWIILECASNPSPNWHPKYRNFLIEREEIIQLVLEKQKLWKSTVHKNVLLITCKLCNKTVKHRGESGRFWSAWRAIPPLLGGNSLQTPGRDSKSCDPKSQCAGSQRPECSGDFPSTCLRAVSAHLLLKKQKQSKDTLLSIKHVA